MQDHAAPSSFDRSLTDDTFRAFVEFAPDAIVIADRLGTIVLVNAQTEAMFGYPREELIGRPLEMLLPERLREPHRQHRSSYLADPVPRSMGAGKELLAVRSDGTELATDISISPLRTKDGILLVAAIRDVTERKRLEALRDKFISNAAHELRTPLATLSTLSETLALRMNDMSSEQITDVLAALHRQGHRASQLVTNLLDLSQIEGGRMQLHLAPVLVSDAVARALESAPSPAGKSVERVPPMEFQVIADAIRLEQVVSNVLTNAYRYGGPHIVIECHEDGDGNVMSISDDGEGVEADVIPHLFEPFTRSKAAGLVGGSGIGLAICRELVNAFGGQIWHEPTHPNGTRIMIRLRRPA